MGAREHIVPFAPGTLVTGRGPAQSAPASASASAPATGLPRLDLPPPRMAAAANENDTPLALPRLVLAGPR